MSQSTRTAAARDESAPEALVDNSAGTPQVGKAERSQQSLAERRERRIIILLLAGSVVAGGLLQIFVPPGPAALVAASAVAGAVILGLALALPGKLKVTVAGFRFVSSLLFALAIAAILGTLVLQGKPAAFYEEKYGGLVGGLIVLLRLDDIFHSLWFAGLLALFGASVIVSAVLRWPVRLRNAGFFACHVGLITSLTGAALSTTMSVKGRIDLNADVPVTNQVVVTKGPGAFERTVPLGFDLRLDKFELVRYSTEYRVGYYEQKAGSWALKASFDPDAGVKHRLPGGDSFRLKGLYPDLTFTPRPEGGVEFGTRSSEMKNPAALIEVRHEGQVTEQLIVATRGGGLPVGEKGVLTFERREDEVKAFKSSVTASRGGLVKQAVVAVNEPLAFGGWTLYQANYNPKDPTYSGIDAVYDPGVNWVFAGFALIAAGVFYMFYVENRLKRRA